MPLFKNKSERAEYTTECIARFNRCFDERSSDTLAEAFNWRASLAKNGVAFIDFNAENLNDALIAIASKDVSVYTSADESRFGTLLDELGLGFERKNHMTELDVLMYEAAAFYAISNIWKPRESTEQDDDQVVTTNEIKLFVSELNPLLALEIYKRQYQTTKETLDNPEIHESLKVALRSLIEEKDTTPQSVEEFISKLQLLREEIAKINQIIEQKKQDYVQVKNVLEAIACDELIPDDLKQIASRALDEVNSRENTQVLTLILDELIDVLMEANAEVQKITNRDRENYSAAKCKLNATLVHLAVPASVQEDVRSFLVDIETQESSLKSLSALREQTRELLSRERSISIEISRKKHSYGLAATELSALMNDPNLPKELKQDDILKWFDELTSDEIEPQINRMKSVIDSVKKEIQTRYDRCKVQLEDKLSDSTIPDSMKFKGRDLIASINSNGILSFSVMLEKTKKLIVAIDSIESSIQTINREHGKAIGQLKSLLRMSIPEELNVPVRDLIKIVNEVPTSQKQLKLLQTETTNMQAVCTKTYDAISRHEKLKADASKRVIPITRVPVRMESYAAQSIFSNKPQQSQLPRDSSQNNSNMDNPTALLLVFVGVALIAGSIALAVTSQGFLSPLSVYGINLGLDMLVAVCCIGGLGLAVKGAHSLSI